MKLDKAICYIRCKDCEYKEYIYWDYSLTLFAKILKKKAKCPSCWKGTVVWPWDD